MTNEQMKSWLGEQFSPSSDDDWLMIDAAAQHFFRPTAPIDENSLFVGRIGQIQELLEVIYQAGAHAIVYGERGVGKSSLANIINERIIGPSKFNKVLKISCSPNDTFATVWGNTFFDYEYEGRKVAAVVAENPQPFTIFKIAEALPKTTKHLVILDEFDRIKDEQTKTLVADTIKYLSDNPLPITVLVVGVGKSISELFGSHPSIQRCCIQVHMPRMDPAELRKILDERLPKLHMTAEERALEQIVRFAQGLPGYAHLLGMLSVRAAVADRTQTITTSHVRSAVANALAKADESTRAEYYKAIQSTKPDNRYREVLLACALATKNERGQFSASDVCDPYSDIRGKPMGIESFARHLNAFCDPDRGPALVREGKPKRYLYHFHNPVLEPLVIMKGVSEEGATTPQMDAFSANVPSPRRAR
jgi:Cdc6-like AAA superfamily ATPase